MKYIYITLLLGLLYTNVSSFCGMQKSCKIPSLSLRIKPQICETKSCLNNPNDYSRFIAPNHRTPIPLINFDNIVMNTNIINRVFISTNCDRIIVCYGNKKGVFYINNEKSLLSKIEYILSQLETDILIEHPFNMDNPRHELYCEPKSIDNITEKDYEDYLDNYTSNMEDEFDDFEENDDFNDYGYGFGIE